MGTDLEVWIPIRLCCGTQHWGAVCPGGWVMCCVCFNRVPIGELTTQPDGCKVDVCMGCTIDEARYINEFNIERCKHGTDTSGT